jgi:GNAT superfamily N-acetyltransferase
MSGLAGTLDGASLRLDWHETPWDSALLGSPALNIATISVCGPSADREFAAFERARAACGSRFVACRLPADRHAESMLLESAGFRFIEMVCQPVLADLEPTALPPHQPLEVAPCTADDVESVEAIAGAAFRHERFHADPRLPRGIGDDRYRNWVRSSMTHPRQRLHVLREAGRPVAFFVTEALDDGTTYWHLNAVAPGAQGRGIGRRAWLTMIARAAHEGATRVRSSIVLRNLRVLNLYASLGFRFEAPSMTFHWVA